MTSVVTSEEESILDQTMVDLEINSWETLSEQVNEPSVVGRWADAKAEVERGDIFDEQDIFVPEAGSSLAEEEERALTAAALNDLFYLVDAQAEAVNALEEIFSGCDVDASWDVEEQDDPEDVAKEKRMDDIRKLFEIVDLEEQEDDEKK